MDSWILVIFHPWDEKIIIVKSLVYRPVNQGPNGMNPVLYTYAAKQK